jgi:hypothetical protein
MSFVPRWSIVRWIVTKVPVSTMLVVQAATVAAGSDNPQPAMSSDYVQIHAGKFELHGQPFVVRGTNYFGSWRFPEAFSGPDGIDRATVWSLYQAWDAHKAALDFDFLRSKLRATAVRIGTPSRDNFAALVLGRGYKPWYNPDGSITDHYKRILVELADTAYAYGIRIQFCLLWNVSGEITESPGDFAPGGALDRFYSAQVRSIGMALRDHPGAMAFSVGNEVLVRWPVNGTHPSAYEGPAAAFIARRLHDIRAVAPRQLLTVDEVASPGSHLWHDPGPEFALVGDSARSQAAHIFRLADEVDYLGPHFYPEVLRTADLRDESFRPKIADACQKLADYMKAAKTIGKPVVINEFGLKIDPPTLTTDEYSKPRDELYNAFVPAAEREGVQGILPWLALPSFVLRPEDYKIVASHLNPYSSIEVDIKSSGRRLLLYEPVWQLFDWRRSGEEPLPTESAEAIAVAWPGVPPSTR